MQTISSPCKYTCNYNDQYIKKNQQVFSVPLCFPYCSPWFTHICWFTMPSETTSQRHSHIAAAIALRGSTSHRDGRNIPHGLNRSHSVDKWAKHLPKLCAEEWIFMDIQWYSPSAMYIYVYVLYFEWWLSVAFGVSSRLSRASLLDLSLSCPGIFWGQHSLKGEEQQALELRIADQLSSY